MMPVHNDLVKRAGDNKSGSIYTCLEGTEATIAAYTATHPRNNTAIVNIGESYWYESAHEKKSVAVHRDPHINSTYVTSNVNFQTLPYLFASAEYATLSNKKIHQVL